MYNLNPKMFDINVVDGPAFVTMLLKLGRMCEDVLLGKASESAITFENLQIVKEVGSLAGASLSRSLSRSPSTTLSRSPSSSSLSRSPSSGLPALSPMKQKVTNASPGKEVVCTERGVSRGAGEDNAFVFSHEGFYDDNVSVGSFGVSRYGDDDTRASASDPYIAYMKLSPLIAVSSPTSPGTTSSLGEFSPERASHSSRSPLRQKLSPLQPAASVEGHSVADCSVTSELTFSPVTSGATRTKTSNSTSMVANLIGANPWSEQLEQQKSKTSKGRCKTAGSVHN